MNRKGILILAAVLLLFSQVMGVMAQAKGPTAASVVTENKFKGVKADYTLKFSL